jgi:CrcB protein
MKKLLAVAFGGAFGALVRYLLHNIVAGDEILALAIITLLINISGSFLIGFGTAMLNGKVSDYLKEGLFTGFLGGYTTFSTLSKEVFIIRETSHMLAIALVLVSAAAGIMLAYIGLNLGEKMVERRTKE